VNFLSQQISPQDAENAEGAQRLGIAQPTKLDKLATSQVKSAASSMSTTAHNPDSSPLLGRTNVAGSLNTRILRVMIVTTTVAVFAAVLFAPWRVATGLFIGGLLALLSHRWLQTSVSAVIALAVGGQKPTIHLAKFVLRYLVIGTVAFVAYKLRIASLSAMLAGLCSFVVALFAEAAREFYFVIIHREDTN
jgi:hypothetical protein